jgi:hypothetical protein
MRQDYRAIVEAGITLQIDARTEAQNRGGVQAAEPPSCASLAPQSGSVSS